MADSTLDPDNIPEPDRKLGRGKGTSALGPGDISDSGSDVQGELRRTGEVGLGLDTGTNEDPDSVSSDPSAGPDIGDAMLDSDTDAMGTGERATAGRDHELAGSDIDIDRIEDITPDDNPDLDDLEHPDSRARQARDANRPAPRR
jgi:hypothetical protein